MAPYQESGLLGTTARRSRITLLAGLGGLLVLGSIDISFWIAGHPEIPRNPHAIVAIALVVDTICSTIVLALCYAAAGQRKLTALIDAPGRGYAAGYADGVAGRAPSYGRIHLVSTDS